MVAVVLGEDWYEYDMRATEFLEGLLAGLIEHPSWDPVERHSFTSLNHLPGEESATSSVGGVVWLPEVLVRIDPADDHLDLDALLGWLWDDEALNEASTSIGTIRSAQTNNRTVVEVTLRDFRGLPVLGASVAAWMRANKVLLTATLTRDDATTSVESATPEAVEELIRTLGTVE